MPATRVSSAAFGDHYADVLGFALRRLDGRAAAEDAVAETFAVAWRRRDVLPSRPVALALRDRLPGDRRPAPLAAPSPRLGGAPRARGRGGAGGDDPAAAIDRRDAFAVAFSRLTEAEREVLRLVAWDGLGTNDAARVLGCSPGAFRVRLHRARGRLAKQLRRAGHSPDERPAMTPDPAEEAS